MTSFGNLPHRAEKLNKHGWTRVHRKANDEEGVMNEFASIYLLEFKDSDLPKGTNRIEWEMLKNRSKEALQAVSPLLRLYLKEKEMLTVLNQSVPNFLNHQPTTTNQQPFSLPPKELPMCSRKPRNYHRASTLLSCVDTMRALTSALWMR
jgi:hypothetical protein